MKSYRKYWTLYNWQWCSALGTIFTTLQFLNYNESCFSILLWSQFCSFIKTTNTSSTQLPKCTCCRTCSVSPNPPQWIPLRSRNFCQPYLPPLHTGSIHFAQVELCLYRVSDSFTPQVFHPPLIVHQFPAVTVSADARERLTGGRWWFFFFFFFPPEKTIKSSCWIAGSETSGVKKCRNLSEEMRSIWGMLRRTLNGHQSDTETHS